MWGGKEDDLYYCSGDCSCLNNPLHISFPRNSDQSEFVSGKRSYTMMVCTWYKKQVGLSSGKWWDVVDTDPTYLGYSTPPLASVSNYSKQPTVIFLRIVPDQQKPLHLKIPRNLCLRTVPWANGRLWLLI